MIRFLLLGFVLISTYTARAEPLRVLTYNVLYGFNHGKAQEIGSKWGADKKPDIVAKQELNNFKKATLEKIVKTHYQNLTHAPNRRHHHIPS